MMSMNADVTVTISCSKYSQSLKAGQRKFPPHQVNNDDHDHGNNHKKLAKESLTDVNDG